MKRILVLNYGGTSAKIAIFEDKNCVFDSNVDYSEDEIGLSLIAKEDVALKKKKLLEILKERGFSIDDFDAIAPRLGGSFYGGEGGTFIVEGKLKENLDAAFDPYKQLSHATFGTMALVEELLADTDKKIKVLTTDPSTIDQFLKEARITGNALFIKRNAFHALNQRAVARKAAEELGTRYNECNLIVVHMGGGVSVGAHMKGRIIDVNDSSGDGDGSFSPNRSGTLPTGQLVHLCFSGKYTEKEVFEQLKGKGGIVSYLGTEDLRKVEEMIHNGNEEAEIIMNALAHQISREIGACYAVLHCECDAIVLTAGMAHSDYLVDLITDHVKKIAPIFRYPGGFESEALALGALRVMNGEEAPGIYEGEEKTVKVIM